MNMLIIMSIAAGVALLVGPYLRRDSQWLRWLLIGFAGLVVVRYGVWRIVNLPHFELTPLVLATYAFFLVEAAATYLAHDDFQLLKQTVSRTPEADQQLDWYGQSAPRVDVLIVTYNESWEVLEKTLVGATSQNYPNYAVWILDDGNRTWLRERAQENGVHYIARTDNAHAKAGNLNHGLAQIRARGAELEFLAILDADFIARPEFLRRTLALMKTEDVGLVQTPQCFYNPDPHQQAFGGVKAWPDEQRGWFDIYLPALDALGWASCCGTSCLVRVKALEAIGGFPTESVCEDTLTSIKMSQKGWRTAFLQEPLSVGLAPEGIGEFMTQRARWVVGGVQNQRFCGAEPGLWNRFKYYLNLWRLAIWGIMPALWMSMCVLYLFTGMSFIKVQDFDEAMSYFGPFWLIRFFQGWLFAGRQHIFISDAIWALLAPLWVRETYRGIVGSKARFKVTDKAQHRETGVIHWELLWLHGLFAAALVAGLLYSLFDPNAVTHGDAGVPPNAVMAVWFVLIMVAGLAPAFEPPRRRTADRYVTRETVIAHADGERFTWRCRDISVGGALVDLAGVRDAPEYAELHVADVGLVSARRVRTTSDGAAAYAFHSAEARPALIRKLYCSDHYIALPNRWSFATGIGQFFRWLVC